MPLSEYEQRMLEQMERQLRTDDPKLADTLGSRRAARSRVLLGSLLLLAGVGMLVAGVATQLPWLGVLGFVAMFAGVWLAVSAPRQQTSVPAGPRTAGPRPVGHRSFMQRMEDRWERRRHER
jgi:hypothetical protein